MRVHPQEYSLCATRGEKSLHGFQSLLGVYLIALSIILDQVDKLWLVIKALDRLLYQIKFGKMEVTIHPDAPAE
jgi:hypothetical protein